MFGNCLGIHLLGALFSYTIILMGKRLVYFNCLPNVLQLLVFCGSSLLESN